VIPEAVEELGWRVLARSEVEPRPKENEVVYFVSFHLLGFGAPLTEVVAIGSRWRTRGG
jgi:hypothetical protein